MLDAFNQLQLEWLRKGRQVHSTGACICVLHSVWLKQNWTTRPRDDGRVPAERVSYLLINCFFCNQITASGFSFNLQCTNVTVQL